jgi:chaperonin cofactor prefoldin
MENNMDKVTTFEERHEELKSQISASRDGLTEVQKNNLELSLTTDHGTPYFKIKNFVGNAQVTPFQKYKQFLLELRSREEVIENLLMNVAKQEAAIEVIEEALEGSLSPARSKQTQFELITNKNDLVKIHRRIKQAYEERTNFMNALDEMHLNGEDVLSDGTPFSKALSDPALSDMLEAEHWRFRLGKQAALDLITTGRIGTGNMEAISMMEEKDAIAALHIAINWSTRIQVALDQMQADTTTELTARGSFSLALDEGAKKELS